MDMDMSDVGSRLKKRRLSLGLTLSQITEAVGVSSGFMSEIENGKKLPASNTLCLLSQALDCSIDWILMGEFSDRENSLNVKEKKLDLTPEEVEMLNLFNQLSFTERRECIGYIRGFITASQRQTITTPKKTATKSVGKSSHTKDNNTSYETA